jgi:hypothetical protein
LTVAANLQVVKEEFFREGFRAPRGAVREWTKRWRCVVAAVAFRVGVRAAVARLRPSVLVGR